MEGTHTFPTTTPDWSNLDVLHRNTLPPRASFLIYDNVKDALARHVPKSKTLCLSGTWKFDLAKGPFHAPPNFFEQKFDVAEWSEIQVPGMWQLQGFGKGPQ
jgi:beta-galactosidase